MDPEKREKIGLCHFQDDRDRAIVGDAFARALVCGSLGLEIGDLAISLSPHGKPYVRGLEGFEFNISHSGNWVVCGIGKGRIGVDVERIGDADDVFAERYFTPYESKMLRDSDREIRRRLFFSIWTLKESYVKALGKGLAVPLDGFSMVFRSDGIRAVSGSGDTGFHFKLFENMDPHFSFALCCEHAPPESARVWTLDALARELRRVR